MDTAAIYEIISKGGIRISTDTRTLLPGDIYFAIKGEQFDGNAFASDALSKGARLAIIDNSDHNIDDRCIVVDNARKTLDELAKIHRSKFSIPILTIGGSNGKTTTKELVHAVLEKKYKTHVTKGNLNNDLGVPLTILAMPPGTEIAIIEIGANHPGEHRSLLSILSPTHAVVTNNGADHLEGFISIAGVRAANKEFYEWMREHKGHVLVNKDIPDLVEDSEGIERTLYPSKPIESTSSIRASVLYDNIIFSSELFGSYNEPNILAAIAIGEYFGIPIEDIKEAIKDYRPTLKRSQVIEKDTYSLILDCYNANPSSMEVALSDFSKTTPAGTRIWIVGDMLEMGTEEARVHKEILEKIKALSGEKDIVLIVGPRFGTYKNEYRFLFFENAEQARGYFNTLDLSGKNIFVKASRGIKLEEVIKEKAPL